MNRAREEDERLAKARDQVLERVQRRTSWGLEIEPEKVFSDITKLQTELAL